MAGDTASFDEFYRQSQVRVVHLVYATTGDLSLAQECAQEAFAKAWADWDKVSAHGDPLAWVRTVARRLAISRWRSEQARGRAYARHGPSDRPAGAGTSGVVDRVVVLGALAQLSEALRETVTLHYIADLSVDQIARELGIPPGTVKARLHRGRAQLATLIGDPDATLTSRKETHHG